MDGHKLTRDALNALTKMGLELLTVSTMSPGEICEKLRAEGFEGDIFDLATTPKFVKMTISANAANKLNLGDYSSAERGVFMSKEIQVDESLPAQEQIDFIRNETKKLQVLCEAQLAGIVSAFFSKECLNQPHWTNVHNSTFTKAIGMVKAAFGIAEAPKAP